MTTAGMRGLQQLCPRALVPHVNMRSSALSVCRLCCRVVPPVEAY